MAEFEVPSRMLAIEFPWTVPGKLIVRESSGASHSG
jgi:hypothetical protein